MALFAPHIETPYAMFRYLPDGPLDVRPSHYKPHGVSIGWAHSLGAARSEIRTIDLLVRKK